MELLHRELTDRIINVFYAVYDELGSGFLEKICQAAMVMALRSAGLKVAERVPFEVYFRGQLLGTFIADIVVEGLVLIEIKSRSALTMSDEAQVMNYLRASNLEVALIMNFGAKPEFRRRVYTNARKAERGAHPAVVSESSGS
jgi:GxxExxY protein